MDHRKSILVDLTQCVGCGSCAVACKLWNGLSHHRQAPASGKSPVMDHHNWTTVTQLGVEKEGKPVWRFVKRQCMHCNEPACVSACFSKALQKTEKGPVVYRPDLCVGCRYCMIACPFDIPKYEWGKTLPSISKCQMCPTRLDKAEAPACSSVCPTGALLFADRAEILGTARTRLRTGRYVDHLFGEKEAGGTTWLYLSDVPFAALGFPTHVPKTSLPRRTEDFLKWTPSLLIGGTLLFSALSFVTRRRQAASAAKQAQAETSADLNGEKP